MNELTDDLIERIAVAGGQETAIQYMFLNTYLYGIASRPACWKSMHVKTPGIESLSFLAKTATQCESLFIDSSKPVDAAWFVHGAAMHSRVRTNRLRRLHINIDAEYEDVPNNLVASSLAFDGLYDLRIAITYTDSDHVPTHFFIPKTSEALPTLTSFKFYDRSGGLPGALSLIFGGSQEKMIKLHTLKVAGPYTDLFDAIPEPMPALRNIMYLTNGIPLNMKLPSPRIDVLEIIVHTGQEARTLFKVLERGVSIDTLILHDARLMPVFRCTASIRRVFMYIDTHVNMAVHIDTERLSSTVKEINIYGPRLTPWNVSAPTQPERKKPAIGVFRVL